MSKIWPIFGNIILFILVVGGASYILIQFVGREDDPEPQILEEVKIDAGEVVANEAVVDEVLSSDSVQEQTIATGPTRVVTATSSLSSTAPYLKLTSLTRFDYDTHGCPPRFSPSGNDSYLCYLSVNDERQLWLASLDEGLKRPLATNQRLDFAWFDNQHILYSPGKKKSISK